MDKKEFQNKLRQFTEEIKSHLTYKDGKWSIKGFVDIYKNTYTISSDTKIISKILEIHIFPKIKEFAESIGFDIELPEHQNYYPDMTFIKISDKAIKYAVDFKTTYRINGNFCNGFTLGSHGEYFINRDSKKNICRSSQIAISLIA